MDCESVDDESGDLARSARRSSQQIQRGGTRSTRTGGSRLPIRLCREEVSERRGDDGEARTIGRDGGSRAELALDVVGERSSLRDGAVSEERQPTRFPLIRSLCDLPSILEGLDEDLDIGRVAEVSRINERGVEGRGGVDENRAARERMLDGSLNRDGLDVVSVRTVCTGVAVDK